MTTIPFYRLMVFASMAMLAAGCAAAPVTFTPAPGSANIVAAVKNEASPGTPARLSPRTERKAIPVRKVVAVRKREAKIIDPLAAAENLRSGVNARLQKVPVVGYPPYRAYIRPKRMSVMIKDALPIIRETLGKLPGDYVLRITGHSNQHPRKRRSYTKWMAKRRAWRMYNYLKSIGLPKSKMIYRGMANDQPLDPKRPRDPRNRRVSFDFVRK